ncbi:MULTISPECIES: hypothetical protein [unclassified Pseudomonas]|uniref:hypothetical protein n=1 Tax=unclassified Pseudomonas TaxID=196821 RepID=UPI00244D6807|nr:MULTISPECIES: hypothetical protein [unclassified Pseudomonas]MDG9928773.1 hypothetical protein [Pseudomonas sp. GD04042]MDH0481842.1 hypothetical protein [Pseudomonas sp. GD04015]MDH0603214.1 hypothetical protein [Pseudomonas sp. GD03869]
MRDIDSKVFQYTVDFSRQVAADIDLAALQENIVRHLDSARRVVTNETLERIGHIHLAVMINTAARYNLSLAEVMMEAVRQGVQPVSPLCVSVQSAKSSSRRTSKRPTLSIVK